MVSSDTSWYEVQQVLAYAVLALCEEDKRASSPNTRIGVKDVPRLECRTNAPNKAPLWLESMSRCDAKLVHFSHRFHGT